LNIQALDINATLLILPSDIMGIRVVENVIYSESNCIWAYWKV